MLAPTLNNLIETFALFSGIFLFLTIFRCFTVCLYSLMPECHRLKDN